MSDGREEEKGKEEQQKQVLRQRGRSKDDLSDGREEEKGEGEQQKKGMEERRERGRENRGDKEWKRARRGG